MGAADHVSCLVLVPTYNEAQNLPALMERLFALGLPDVAALVIDDSSPDGTGELAERLSSLYGERIFVLHRTTKEGLGPAYLAGYKRALEIQPTYVAQMDADLSHPPELLPRLLECLESCDVAIASRYVSGGGVAPEWGIARRLLSRGGNLYARLITGIPVRDITSGFRCFRREVLERLRERPIRCRSFGFQVEVAYWAWRQQFRLREIPFTFALRSNGASKISANTVLEALWRLPQLRFTE